MAGVLQHLRSLTLNKRPNPASMVDGQIAINYASGSPGAFFKDTNGNLVKVGPVHVGATAPNVSPASGGTAGNSLGEQWLDTSGDTYVFKIWDGAAWRSEAGEFVNVTGDTMTGSLTMGPSANLIFEGSTDDGFETTLTVVDPTADRTITLPNISGTVVTTGDSGTVTSAMIADGTIVNGDVSASAAIAGTKISPDFGSQNVVTTGTSTAASFIPTSSTAPSNGIYSPGADQVAISTGGTGRLFVDASGNVGVGTNDTANAFVTLTNQDVSLRLNPVTGSASITAVQTGVAFRDLTIGSNQTIFQTAATERLRITSTGTLNIVGAGSAGVTQAVSFNGSAPVNSLVVDSSGRLLVGTSSSVSTGGGANIQQIASPSNDRMLGVHFGGGSATGPYITFSKSRSSTYGSYSIVNSGDVLGGVIFAGDDGTDYATQGAYIEAYVDGTPGVNDLPTRLVFSTNPGSPETAPVERMRITNGGLIDIGGLYSVGANAIRFDVQGSNFSRNTTSSATQIAFVNPNGTVGTITTSGSATAYNTSSDYRLKENVSAVTDGITRLQQLKPSRFNFIAEPDKTVDGFIAHEVQAVVPEAITGEKDAVDAHGKPVYQGIDQSKLVPLLTAALQEAIAKIESLEARLTAAGI